LTVVTLSRDDFPGSLNDWTDAQELFCDGHVSFLNSPCVSVIGTRKISDVGTRRAAAVTRLLAKSGYCIVSGLAAGVDSVAHEVALSIGGKTIAVLGTPLDRVYPANNVELRRAIEDKGLVISQFPNGSKTFKSNFPKRNRLMAALCHLTVVIEASELSGTRHQVKTALELGRSVALPVSLAQSGYPWVVDALKSSRTHVLTELSDLSSFLAG
jgi:DNA processing protein